FGYSPETAKRLEELQKELNTATERYDSELRNVSADLFKLNTSFSAFFTRMKNETLSVTDTFKVAFQNAFTQLNNDFASSVGQWIERGGDFGRAMQNMSVHMLTSFTEALIKMAAKKAESKVFDAFTSKGAAPTLGADEGVGLYQQMEAEKTVAAAAGQ